MKVKEKVTLAKKIIAQAKEEINKEKVEKYKETAKRLLEDMQEAKRTVSLLEKQINNFVREIDLEN